MSEEVWKEIGFFFIIFAAVFCLWLFTNGPNRATSQEGVFIKPPPAANGSGQIYGGVPIKNVPLATTTVIVPGLKK